MKTLQQTNLKAVQLWEIILLFILFTVFMYQVTSFIVQPVSAPSGLFQTQWVIFIASTVGILYIIIQHRRTKLLEIQSTDNETHYIFGKEQQAIKKISVHPFIHKRLPARIVHINARFFLVMPLYHDPFDQIDSAQKEEFLSKILQLESLSSVTEPNSVHKMDWIPFLFNASFYFLLIGALTTVCFLILKVSQS